MADADIPELFSQEHYDHIISEYGYSHFDLARFDFDLGGMRSDELNARYLCHRAADRYRHIKPGRRIVTTGFGMSGPPHMSTASQLMKMVRLQQGGERCQIVLGDLDAYNGRNSAYHRTQELVARFQTFARALGFNEMAGVLRAQADYDLGLVNMYFLGRYASDEDFLAAEEDVHDFYARRGVVDTTMTFRRRLSLALMSADFLTLGQEYDSVLVVLGVDEHKYVRFAEDVKDRLDQESPLRGDFVLAALYNRLNNGFNGYPKFSRSFPESSINVESSDDEIYYRVMSDQVAAPELSPVYQLMYQMTYCSYDELVRAYWWCSRRDPRWQSEKARFAEYLTAVRALWPA